MRLPLLVIPLLVAGCHRPWLEAQPASSSVGTPFEAGPATSWSSPPQTETGGYQPAVHHAPPSASPPVMLGHEAAGAAQALEGRPYCWGGTGPDCYDCSGLASAAWARVGVVLPRTSDAMRQTLRRVHWHEVQPGDVLWRPGHVGLYVERGWAIHAPGEGKTVQYQPAQTYDVVLRPY
ncbi:MAG: NlpC/P60 family protein [Polyangiaceae bacterium]